MNHQQRLAKLVALARDPSNPHEAGTAARRAQELIQQHQLPTTPAERQALAMARVRALKAKARGV